MTEREMRDELDKARRTLTELKRLIIDTGDEDVAVFNRKFDLVSSAIKSVDRVDRAIQASTDTRDVGGVMTDPVF